MDNDSELARQYAMDIDLLQKNGAEAKPPPYRIIGDVVTFAEDIQVNVISRYPSGIKVSKIIREHLSFSRSAFDKMVSDGTVQLKNGADIYKCRIQQGITVLFYKITQ